MYIQRKQINRSLIRSFLGNKYYIMIRYMKWMLDKKDYASDIKDYTFDNIIFSHKTPLLRKLKDVDMILQYNKIKNLEIAIKKLSGTVVKPGQTLSYWRLIGKPTKKKGYKEGVILTPQGSFKSGIGGGLCQLSNLIYWMTLHTELNVIERYRHSHDVFPDSNRTQPFGTGATCCYNYLDLQIYNNTNKDYQLVLYLKDDYLCGEWRAIDEALYTYEVYEKNHSITPGLFGGYIRNNEIYRKTLNRNGEVIKDEYITENHAFMTYAPYLSE